MNKEANKKMTKARVNLIMNAPFFSSIALKMKMEEVPDTWFTSKNHPPAMCTDGKNIYYSAAFVNSISLKEIIAVIIHEVFHIILMHTTRQGGRDIRRFGMSCDYAVNLLVKDAKYELPYEPLLDEKYRNMLAEKIYTMLPVEEQGQQSSGGKNKNEDEQGENPNPDQSWDIGGVMGAKNDDGSEMSNSEKEQYEQEMKVSIDQAMMIAKKEGKLPAGMDRLIDEILNPQLDYKEILARFMTENAKNDYSWRRPNRRYIHQDIYLPSLDSPQLSEGILAIDTSGSISHEEMNMLGNEIKGVLDLYDTELTVLYVDTKVAGHQKVNKDDVPLNLRPAGGGGTDFRPPFKWIDKHELEPAFLIYFTDGWCSSFPSIEPDYPTLWILTEKNDSFKPPFGEVIYMNYRDN